MTTQIIEACPTRICLARLERRHERIAILLEACPGARMRLVVEQGGGGHMDHVVSEQGAVAAGELLRDAYVRCGWREVEDDDV